MDFDDKNYFFGWWELLVEVLFIFAEFDIFGMVVILVILFRIICKYFIGEVEDKY